MSSILNFLSDNILTLAGGLWGVVGVVITYTARQYLVPLMQVEKKRRYAGWIAAIADELTDDLMVRFPGKTWLEELDKAIDKIIEICGIDREIANRAIKAAAARKQS